MCPRFISSFSSLITERISEKHKSQLMDISILFMGSLICIICSLVDAYRVLQFNGLFHGNVYTIESLFRYSSGKLLCSLIH